MSQSYHQLHHIILLKMKFCVFFFSSFLVSSITNWITKKLETFSFQIPHTLATVGYHPTFKYSMYYYFYSFVIWLNSDTFSYTLIAFHFFPTCQLLIFHNLYVATVSTQPFLYNCQSAYWRCPGWSQNVCIFTSRWPIWPIWLEVNPMSKPSQSEMEPLRG